MTHLSATHQGVEEPMPKQTHLLKRRGSNSYYVRRRIPLDLLQYYHPKKEIQRSLRETDHKKALVKLREATAQIDQEFAQAREALKAKLHPAMPTHQATPPPSLTLDDLKRLASLQMWTELTKGDLHQAGRRNTGIQPDWLRGHLEAELARHKAALVDPDDKKDTGGLGIVVNDVDLLLIRDNLVLEKDSPTYEKLSELILQNKIKAFESRLKRLDGEIIETPPRPEMPKKGPKLSEVLGMYVEDRRRAGTKEEVIKDACHKVQAFIQSQGDLPIEKITKHHVIAFKQELVRRKLGNRTIKEKYLAFLKAVLNQAVGNGYIDFSPADKVTVTGTNSLETVREPYSISVVRLDFCRL